MIRFFLALFVLALQTDLSAQNQKFRLLAADMVYFNPGKWDIQSMYFARLQSSLELLKNDPDSYLVLHSHTDSVGSYKDNELLAEKRALSIIDYYKNNGIDTSRLKIRSLGEYSPLEDDGTAEGRAKNRCVTMYIMTPFDASQWVIKSTIRGQLKDAKTGNPLLGRILINHLSGRDTVYTNENGEYTTDVDLESYIEVRAYVKGYFFVSKIVKTKNKETHITDFNLERAIVGGKMLFNDLYFHSDAPTLLPASEKSLQAILTFLQENTDLKIEFGGHVNKPNTPPVTEDSPSFLLSYNRAKAVYDYFVNKGIDANRLSFKGYGNWEMINPRASSEFEMMLNRRVEMKVIGL